MKTRLINEVEEIRHNYEDLETNKAAVMSLTALMKVYPSCL